MPSERTTLIQVDGLSVSIGGRSILDDVSFAVNEGEIVTVVGPNGAGKTVLVRSILGLVALRAGRVEQRAGLTVGYVPQRLQIDPVLPLTVARFLTLGARRSRADVAAALAETGSSMSSTPPCSGYRAVNSNGCFWPAR